MNLIHEVSKQEFKKVRMGGYGGVHNRGNSPPWLQVPINSEEGRKGCSLWGGIWISPFLLIFSESICVTNLHILLKCASLWSSWHRFTQDAWSRLPGPEFLLRKNNFTHQALGAVLRQIRLAVLPLLVGTIPPFTSPALLLPAPIQFQSHTPRSWVTSLASALRVHPSVRTTCKSSKELEIFRGERMLGDPSTSLSFRRGN